MCVNFDSFLTNENDKIGWLSNSTLSITEAYEVKLFEKYLVLI